MVVVGIERCLLLLSLLLLLLLLLLLCGREEATWMFVIESEEASRLLAAMFSTKVTTEVGVSRGAPSICDGATSALVQKEGVRVGGKIW